MTKKIIWVFGESGTGKKTLIENILSNKDNVRNLFDLNNYNIKAVLETILSFEEEITQKIDRKKAILKGIDSFLSDTNDILLIKGQIDDLEYEENNSNKQNTFLESIKQCPNIEKEIYLLEIPNTDILYDRMTHKDWWQSNPEYYANWLPRSKWDTKTEEQRNKLLPFLKYGIDLKVIDTTDGYKIEKEIEYGKSSSSRR